MDVVGGSVLRCPYCHASLVAGQVECSSCGRSLQGDAPEEIEEPLTWPERLYVAWAWSFVVAGAFQIFVGFVWRPATWTPETILDIKDCLGIGILFNGRGGPPSLEAVLAMMGIAGALSIVIGLALLRQNFAAILALRVIGALIVIAAGAGILGWILARDIIPGAKGGIVLNALLLAYWLVLEYLLWVVPD